MHRLTSIDEFLIFSTAKLSLDLAVHALVLFTMYQV